MQRKVWDNIDCTLFKKKVHDTTNNIAPKRFRHVLQTAIMRTVPDWSASPSKWDLKTNKQNLNVLDQCFLICVLQVGLQR